MLIQHGGQHEPRAIDFPQYLALQLVGGEGDFDILVLVPHTSSRSMAIKFSLCIKDLVGARYSASNSLRHNFFFAWSKFSPTML